MARILSNEHIFYIIRDRIFFLFFGETKILTPLKSRSPMHLPLSTPHPLKCPAESALPTVGRSADTYDSMARVANRDFVTSRRACHVTHVCGRPFVLFGRRARSKNNPPYSIVKLAARPSAEPGKKRVTVSPFSRKPETFLKILARGPTRRPQTVTGFH